MQNTSESIGLIRIYGQIMLSCYLTQQEGHACHKISSLWCMFVTRRKRSAFLMLIMSQWHFVTGHFWPFLFVCNTVQDIVYFPSQELRAEKDNAEQKIDKIACDIASDLGLIMDKSIRLEWYKVSNTRTRCLRITQVSRTYYGSQWPCFVNGDFDARWRVYGQTL